MEWSQTNATVSFGGAGGAVVAVRKAATSA